MTKKELLTTYRALVIELEELRAQLQRVGSDGRPSGVRTMQPGHICGTNAPGAAALQLAEGLEMMAGRKEEELRQMADQVDALLTSITDYRTYMVILHYYKCAETDEQVASLMALSKSRVNQIRQSYLAA